jgi:hypothetical protein
MVFNVSMMACASALAGVIFQHNFLAGVSQFSAPMLLTLATLTFFLGQTVPVSIIIALTDGGAVRHIWQSMAQMVFPYFVASAGTAMVNSAGNHIGWAATMALLPVMYGIHRSYRTYFAGLAEAVCQPPAQAMAAGAGASQ